MQWLNYQHLLYFWAVARRGSVTAAANELRLSAPTLSAQIRKLEESFGQKLLRRSGQRLVLTDAGRRIIPYAEEIFSLGQQVTEIFQGAVDRGPVRLAIGSVDILPRWLTYRLIEPALRQLKQVNVLIRKDRPERLLADLAAHDLDVVFSDVPLVPAIRAKFSTVFLGECAMSFYAKRGLATKFARNFPHSLEGAPLLLPIEYVSIGRALDVWFASNRICPRIVGRFDDFAMARVFAEAGEGILAAPSVIETDLESRYQMRNIGRLNAVKAQYYAIALERKVQHPGVAAICSEGKSRLLVEPFRDGAKVRMASA